MKKNAARKKEGENIEHPTSNIQHREKGKSGNGNMPSLPGGGIGVLKRVAYSDIEADPNQPRKVFDEVKLRELADSIASVGLQQDPIVIENPPRYRVESPDLMSNDWRVVETATGNLIDFLPNTVAMSEMFMREKCAQLNGKPYRIVAGERRWRAVGLLGWAEMTVKVVEMSPADIAAYQLVENMQRERLDALEEAEGFQKILDVENIKVEYLAQRLGVSRSSLYQKLGLLKLSEVAKNAYLEGKIEVSIAELISKIPDGKLQAKALKEIMEGGGYVNDYEPGTTIGSGSKKEPMSFRVARAHIHKKYMFRLSDAPFDTKDEGLCPKAGSCVKCPYRTGNAAEMFPEIASKDVCTNPTCWNEKVDANVVAKRLTLIKGGTEVLTEQETKKWLPDHGQWLNGGAPFLPALRNVNSADGKKVITVEEALKRQKVKPVVAVLDDGREVKLFRKEVAEPLLIEMGVIKPPVEPKKETAADKEKREFEAKVKTAARERYDKEVVAALTKVKWTEQLEKGLLMAVADDYENAFTERKEEIKDGPLEKFTMSELRSLIALHLMKESMDKSWVNTDLIKLLKVDVKKIEKEVREQLKAEAQSSKLKEGMEKFVPKKKGKK